MRPEKTLMGLIGTTSGIDFMSEHCLLIDERIVIPTQLRQTVLDSLHLTHPGSAAMLDLCQHVWFPHIPRTIVHMVQNCKHCTEQGKNLKPIIGKKTFIPYGTGGRT